MRAIVVKSPRPVTRRDPFVGCSRVSFLPGAAEPAPIGCAEVFRFIPVGLDDADENPLREPFTSTDTHRAVCKVVNLDVDLVVGPSVVLIDYAHAIRHHQALSLRQTASGGKQEHVSRRNGNDEIGRDKTDFARGNHDVLPAEQIESDRSGSLMAR